MQFGNVGHLVGMGLNVGLPLFPLCVGRALMMSCAVISIAGAAVGGYGLHRGTGDSLSATFQRCVKRP